MNVQNIARNLFKYFLEGAAVAIAAYYIPKRKIDMVEIVMIAVAAGLTFLVLDLFSPEIGGGARLGAGLGIGLRAVSEGMHGDPQHMKQH